jgi:serine/threonine protein kinase
MGEGLDLQRIGRYEIERILGEGAMGRVYEGKDTRLHRKVAVKTILKSALDGDSAKEYSQRFAREAQAVARLNHPNIVQVFDFAEEGDVAYIVMELVRGRELKTFFDAQCTSWASSAMRCTSRTRRASCTATSSRRT